MRLPSQRGLGTLPRYGGGWMHQFGHTYLLQQELLNKSNADWFRAIELWHTARHEGLALNISHYTNILQHTLIEEKDGTWSVALNVLRQMKRDAVRADCRSVSMALNILANEGKWFEALNSFAYFSSSSANNNNINNATGKYSGVGMKLDSVCVAATIRACVAADRTAAAEEFVNALRREAKTSVCPAVDAMTINAAIEELNEVVEKETQQAILENSTSSTRMIEENIVDTEEEVVMVPTAVNFEKREEKLLETQIVGREKVDDDSRLHQEAVKRWKIFFERVG